MHETLDLRAVMVFLFAAGIAVPIMARLRISPVFGFLLVGIAIGPFGLARFTEALPWLSHVLITDLEGVRLLAELGVVFLLFMIGLELSLDRLWAMRRRVFGLGGAQVAITGTLIAGIAWAFGNPLAVAIVLGASFALSSTAIVMQLLSEKRRLGTATGRVSFAILLAQDIAVLPILFLIGVFATRDDAAILPAFALAMAQAALAVVVILVIGRLVIRPVLRFVGSTASHDMFLALVLLVIIGTAMATEIAGLSMALGAFLAGLLFAETEYRHEIEADIDPFKGLLMGLFFVSIGMGIDIARIIEDPLWLPAAVLGLFAIKVPVVYVLARAFGEGRSVALEAGLLLGQGGEFAFLIVSMAFAAGLLPADTAQFMLIVAGLSMVATPLVATGARSLARAVAARDARNDQDNAEIPDDPSGHVLIAGYGRVGTMLGALLDGQEIPHIGIDSDAAVVSGYRRQGASVFFGDANRPETLRRFGADRALALVVTMDHAQSAERVVAAARRAWPLLPVYARARDKAHANRLLKLGATQVVPETLEASLQLGEALLGGIGVPETAARRVVDTRRQVEMDIPPPTAG